jgi:uncharacterized protein YqjF (DUF2071 family)
MALPETFRVAAPPLRGPRIFGQQWRDLAFLHWSIPPELVTRFMPAGVRPDELNGRTYVGLIPFHMRKAGIADFPTPYLGDFAETNVRLYSVDDEGRHGVVFLSLEASRFFTALCARFGYGLPYTWAHMRIGRRGTRMRYVSRRRWPERGLSSAVTVDIGERIAHPSDLEHFLTARWGLHARLAGRTVWHPNSHVPWKLHRATLVALDDDLVGAVGVDVTGPPDVPVMWSSGVHTIFGPPQTLTPVARP